MKKTLCFLSAAILMCSFLCACGKKSDNPIAAAPNTVVSEHYSTTEAQYTVGEPDHSEKVGLGDDEYEIMIYDKDGYGVKLEHYKNDKLKYYYTCSSRDEDGNCVQQKYYSSSNKLLGTFDSGYFFDADGTQITEDMMDLILEKVE